MAKGQLLADVGALAPRRHELRPLLIGGLVLGLTLAADRSVSRELARVTPGEIRAFEPLGRYQVGNVLGLKAAVGGLLGRRTDWWSSRVTLVEANLLASALVGGVQLPGLGSSMEAGPPSPGVGYCQWWLQELPLPGFGKAIII